MGSNFNPFNPNQFNQSTFGTAGNPGFLSPFDLNAAAAGQGQATSELTQQYKDLGLGQNPATPAGPNQPLQGNQPPGSGTTPTTPGSFGAGSIPYQQDIGAAPSVTGGIPAQFQALLGQQQTADLGATTQSAAAALQGKNAQTGLIGSGLGALGKIL